MLKLNGLECEKNSGEEFLMIECNYDDSPRATFKRKHVLSDAGRSSP